MQLTVSAIEPRPYLKSSEELQSKGLLWQKKFLLRLAPGDVGLVGGKEGLAFYLPDGGGGFEMEVARGASILLSPREFTVGFDLSGIRVAGEEATARLEWRLGFLEPETGRPHPLLAALGGELAEEHFLRTLGRLLTTAIGPVWAEIWPQVGYHPGQGPVCAQPVLTECFARPEMRAQLKREAGLAYRQPPRVIALQVPEIDAREGEVKEVAKKLQKKSHAAVVRKAEESEQLQAQEFQHVQEMREKESRLRLEMREKEFRLRLELMEAQAAHQARMLEKVEALAEAEARLKKGLADQVEQEVAAAGAEMRRLNEEIAALDRVTAVKLETIREEMQAFAADLPAMLDGTADRVEKVVRDQVQGAMKNLQQTVAAAHRQGREEQPAARAAKGLAMSVRWRLYDSNRKLVNPELGKSVTLKTNACLDCEVVTDKDAWVYVFMESSQGGWQVLLPDLDQLNGISRSNRQAANMACAWPGTNKEPQYGPFWYLDDEPGYERIMVLASVEQIDPRRLLNKNELPKVIAELQEKAKTLGVRGMLNKPSPIGPSAVGNKPRNKQELEFEVLAERLGKVGNGCVKDVTVIEHVEA
jgi:hypothetical protein